MMHLLGAWNIKFLFKFLCVGTLVVCLSKMLLLSAMTDREQLTVTYNLDDTRLGVQASGSEDVLINTYMRSGSSFLGRVLGFRSDTFYVYEPLWTISKNEYFASDGKKCGTYRQYCKYSSELKTAFDALDQIYNCTFYKEPMRKIFRANINAKLSGKRWDVFRACKWKGHSDTACLTEMATEVCTTSKYKVTKVLRVSLSNMESFLHTRPNMKVVHLFRDPRAIINSHLRTAWSQVRKNSLDSIDAVANSICSRIEEDVKYAMVLSKIFPKRFLILQYEDFNKPLQKIRQLLDFLGMEFTKEVVQYIDSGNKTRSVENRPGNHPFLYREQLGWEAMKVINRHCIKVFHELGYTMFQSVETFRDLSIPAVNSPLPFALL